MSGLRSWAARVRGFLAGNPAGDFESEMATHRELLAEEYMRRGFSPETADEAARREMGNAVLLREEYREQRGLPVVETFLQDLRYGWRTLRRAPTFTAASAGVLGVGIAGVLTMLCVLTNLVLRPLPYPDAGGLVYLHEVDPRAGEWPFSEPMLLQLTERNRTLAVVGGYRQATVAMTGFGDAEAVPGATATPGFFAAFGMKPVAGRFFEGGGGASSVVISRALWKRKWAGDRGVIGRVMRLDGVLYSVTAVADFPQELVPGTDVITPLIPRATESYSAHDVGVVARLRRGITMAQAQADLTALARGVGQEQPHTNGGWNVGTTPLFNYVTGPATVRTVWMLTAAVGLVWLLACANVAGMLMARGATREHEISTRFALGASRGRVFRQMLTESCLLALGGAGIGLLLAKLAVSAIAEYGGAMLPRLAAMEIDWTVAVIALGSLVASTLLFGTTPAWAAAQRRVNFTGLGSGRGIAKPSRGRDGLVVVQVALASVLLLGAVLLFQSFQRLRAVDPGFEPEGVLTVALNLSEPRYDGAHRVAFLGELARRLASVPGTHQVGATNVEPFSGGNTANRFRLEGEPRSAEYRVAGWRSVTPGYFHAMGLRLMRGRFLTDGDVDGSTEVVVISEAMARRFWPGQDPVGRDLLWGRSGNAKRIVGVVSDLRDVDLAVDPAPMMFRPYTQLTSPAMTMVVRTRLAGEATAESLRREIAALDPEMPVEVRRLPQTLAKSIERPRTGVMSVAAFAITALIIAGFGLFGVVSYRVNQRRKEIGIRLALGATPSAVRWEVQKRCLALVLGGLAAGIPVGFAASSYLTAMLYRTAPTEVWAYGAVVAAFAAIAWLASYGPAMRAAKTDPAITLRYE